MKPTSPFWSPSSPDLRGGGSSTAAGCLSRMLRRILCFSSIPLSSFDHFKEEEGEGERIAGAAPGVVARLMGLDALPQANSLKGVSPWSDQAPRANSLRESPGSDQADSFKTLCSSQVRRTRGHVPAYRELEDENFFILSFEKPRKRKSSGNSCRKEKENPENLLLQLNNPCKEYEKTTTRLAKKDGLAAKITFEDENEPENSSPNSVLEFVGFSADQEPTSPEEVSRLANSRMRRPLSEELENCGECKRKAVFDVRGNGCSERLDEVGTMAAMDTTNSSWLYDGILQNKNCFGEIGGEIALRIFDHLLEELVINLQQF